MGAPAYYKENPATRAFERVQQLRAELGSRSDRGLPPAVSELPAAVPDVRSAVPDVRNVPIGPDGQPLPLMPALTPAQIIERNAAWERETGQRFDANNNIIQPGAQDEDMPAPEFNPDELQGPRRAITLGYVPNPQAGTYSPNAALQTAAPPRAIDFAKLQSINPIEGTVVVDGISFKMTDFEKRTAAVMLANIVQRAMADQILSGLKALGMVVEEEVKDGGFGFGLEGVPALPPAGEAAPAPTDELSPEQSAEGRPADLL